MSHTLGRPLGGILIAFALTGCLQTITMGKATGGSSTSTAGPGGTSTGAGATSSGTGGQSDECRGARNATACHLPDGGLAACYGETCQLINFASDPDNCGVFGLLCPPPAVCSDFSCSEPGAGGITCQDGQTQCRAYGQVCVPFAGCEWETCPSDAEDQVCTLRSSPCTAAGCPAEGFCCHNSCLYPFNSDPLNCGGCNVVCQPGAICVQGQCRIPDPHCGPSNNNHLCLASGGIAGACCFSSCVDDSSDSLNCGACGIVCTEGASCQDGVCANDAGDLAGCGTGDSRECPAGTECSWDLFISPCFNLSCGPGSDDIACVLDAGWLGTCCGGACGLPPAGDAGCGG